MIRARNELPNLEPVMIAGTDKCAVCGKRVVTGLPVHKDCIEEQIENRLLTESSIKPFEFWPFEKVKAFFNQNGTDSRCWAETKKSRCVFTVNKKKTKLTAYILIDASIYVCAHWTEDYSEIGYEKLKKQANKHRKDVALCFID